ncbi:MAG TPA: signal recognition particle-docking protein FtsY [Methyloceanibacter sp.]|nr:signal recognition particle-docking protein FtsY [Methyloceanibacter sp.]
MSGDKKPGFFQRLFGIGGDKPKPAEPTPRPVKEPPSDAPKRKPPQREPAKKEPPKDRPARKEPPARKRAPKKAAKPKPTSQPEAPPPAGPAAQPGDTPPDERTPGDREKPSPQEKKAAPVPTEKTPPKPAEQPSAKPVPPPGGPAASPGSAPPEQLPPSERDNKPKSLAESRRGWFDQLRAGLARTSNALSDSLAGALVKRKLDEDTLDEVEEVLIKADLGVAMAGRIRDAIAKGRYDRGLDPDQVRDILAAEIVSVLEPLAQDFAVGGGARPQVFLVVGVNGTGKTTTIGKMAHLFRRKGLRVMLAAADTFRAAAIDQLKIWGERVDAEVVAKDVGADPAGVAYAALERARAEAADVLLIDTAGRLQNKSDLMAELTKIVRVLTKLDQNAPHGVILVLDATTGQNALNQVEIFKEIAGVTGLVVTKLDGTARGGILVAIAERFGVPIHAIGIGEGLDDLKPFDAQDFARAIAGANSKNEAAA